MYDLIKQLNEIAQDRQPIIKVTIEKDDTLEKVLDIQHIPLNNINVYVLRLIKQWLAQFKDTFELKFNTIEDGPLNDLTIKAISKTGKIIKFDISKLTFSDVSNIKKLLY